MASTAIVVVFDAADPKRAEVALTESLESAERMLEALLEAGYAPDRMRVFHGDELRMRVAYRPEVSLGEGDGWETAVAETGAPTPAAREEQTFGEEPEPRDALPPPGGGGAPDRARTRPDLGEIPEYG